MKHNIRLQSWGHRVVVVCENCTLPGKPETALLRSDDAEGPTLADAVAAGELHVLAHTEADNYAGTQVEGQTTFGCGHKPWKGGTHCSEMSCPNYVSKHLGPEEPDLVAFGPVDDYRAPGVSRTGQRLPDSLTGSDRPGGGDPLGDYLHLKGEL